jgi:putative transposase
MATINKDTPCLFVTTVTRNRLPVFRTDSLKDVACGALDEARRSRGFALFAYVIMPEHVHALAEGAVHASEILRYINGILSRRVIGYLREGGFRTSLEKLRGAPKGRGHEYSLVDHHFNALPVFSERFFMQKVNYIHLNPVRAGPGGGLPLVERAMLVRAVGRGRTTSGGPGEDCLAEAAVAQRLRGAASPPTH